MTTSPLRFLAGHPPTCWDLFPAPSIVPEIKMTAVFLWEAASSTKTSQWLFSETASLEGGVENYKTSCTEVVWSTSLQLQPRRRGKSLRQPWNAFSTHTHSTEIAFQSKVFGFISWVCQSRQTWLPAASAQREEAYPNEYSPRGAELPTAPFIFL